MNELEELEFEYIQLHYNDLLIFPKYWEDVNNDKIKIKILKQAIKENKNILDIPESVIFIEGIF